MKNANDVVVSAGSKYIDHIEQCKVRFLDYLESVVENSILQFKSECTLDVADSTLNEIVRDIPRNQLIDMLNERFTYNTWHCINSQFIKIWFNGIIYSVRSDRKHSIINDTKSSESDLTGLKSVLKTFGSWLLGFVCEIDKKDISEFVDKNAVQNKNDFNENDVFNLVEDLCHKEENTYAADILAKIQDAIDSSSTRDIDLRFRTSSISEIHPDIVTDSHAKSYVDLILVTILEDHGYHVYTYDDPNHTNDTCCIMHINW